MIHEEHESLNRNSVNLPRTVEAVALRHTGNLQGSYYFFRLDNWKRVTRMHWTELPMPARVISLIEQKARDEQASPNDPPEDFVFQHTNNDLIQQLTPDDNHLLGLPTAEGATPPQVPVPPPPPTPNDIIEPPIDGAIPEPPPLLLEEPGAPNLNPALPPGAQPNLPETHPNINGDDGNFLHFNEEPDDELQAAQSPIDDQQTSDKPTTNQSDVNPINIIDFELDPSRNGTARYNLRSRREPQHNPKDPNNDKYINLITNIPPTKGFNEFNNKFAFAFTQMSAREGLRRFGEKAANALIDEWKQLDDKNVFDGVYYSALNKEQRQKALRLVQLIKEKRDGKIKGRTCADGRKQREYVDDSESTSPTVSIEALMLTMMIEAKELRDVATCDISGAFLHTDIDEETFVVVDGALVDVLIQANKAYAKFMHTTNSGKKLIFLRLNKALYGTVKAARLFWESLHGTLKNMGFTENKYDKCVVNKIINGNQCTVTWHVDDLKISHVDSNVVTDIIKQIEKVYGEMTTKRGKTHTYVGMKIIYKENETVEIDMKEYLLEAIEMFPELIDKIVTSPAANHLFEVNDQCEKLDEHRRELLHKIVAKILYTSTRGRPDLHLAISFLTSRVSKADTDDWNKLVRLLTYIKCTIDLTLTLSAENLNVVKWWADAAYAVRDDFKSQTGASMSMGRGTIMNKATKQKLNTTSSTDEELVGVSDILKHIIWTNYFLEEQGYGAEKAILYQDNKSAILLEKNGTMSSSKRTRHVNIRYFFIKDRVDSNEIKIEHCGTDEMIADYFTKPLQGAKFIQFRNMILGIIPIEFTL
jgi:hypothetical protein